MSVGLLSGQVVPAMFEKSGKQPKAENEPELAHLRRSVAAWHTKRIDGRSPTTEIHGIVWLKAAWRDREITEVWVYCDKKKGKAEYALDTKVSIKKDWKDSDPPIAVKLRKSSTC